MKKIVDYISTICHPYRRYVVRAWKI